MRPELVLGMVLVTGCAAERERVLDGTVKLRDRHGVDRVVFSGDDSTILIKDPHGRPVILLGATPAPGFTIEEPIAPPDRRAWGGAITFMDPTTGSARLRISFVDGTGTIVIGRPGGAEGVVISVDPTGKCLITPQPSEKEKR